MVAAARDALKRDEQHQLRHARPAMVFVQVYNPPLRLIIVGAVHIAQPLAPMAALAGYGVTVIDPRRAFADRRPLPRRRR